MVGCAAHVGAVPSAEVGLAKFRIFSTKGRCLEPGLDPSYLRAEGADVW